jgi:ElaB/YqjD/DUF883 family membrane-anchored ribosome-binding protein
MSDPEQESHMPAAETPKVAEHEAAQPAAVRSAADAVHRAEAELKKARDFYEKARQQAADRLKAARETRLGDLIDGTLELVRKHPGLGVALAGLIGFFLGRRLRR